MDAKEQIKVIRRELKKRCPTLRVRNGRGAWVEIRGSGAYGEFSDNARATLRLLGLSSGGNFCVISPDCRSYWVEKLTRRDATNGGA